MIVRRESTAEVPFGTLVRSQGTAVEDEFWPLLVLHEVDFGLLLLYSVSDFSPAISLLNSLR